MKHRYTLDDATKAELIEYFFNPISGGYIVGADKDNFLIWLQQKRSGTLLKSYETATEKAHEMLNKYIELIGAANDEPDIKKKLALLKQADSAYKKYQAFDKQSDELGKKFDREINRGRE